MKKSIQAIREDLLELFDVENNLENGTYETNCKFAISKKQMERGEVLGKLSEYFKDIKVDGGFVEVDSITFVHTTFEIKEGKPNFVNN